MILGYYQGIPIGYRVAEQTGTELIIEVFPILDPGPGEGEPLPEAA